MIPIVDCQCSVLSHADEIYQALAGVGFVYLRNFEFAYAKVARVEQAFRQGFWPLDDRVKSIYARAADYKSGGNSGYVSPNVEILSGRQTNVCEIRESFNVTPCESMVMIFKKINLKKTYSVEIANQGTWRRRGSYGVRFV
jgi:isopenicillin N synthase-like dioxygenase